MKGWECPRCGRCYAPHVEKCPKCGPVPTSFGTPAGNLATVPVHICRPGPFATSPFCDICGKYLGLTAPP